MQTVTMDEAKIHLSELVDAAAKGEPFLIAEAGKPAIKVTAVEEPVVDTPQRLEVTREQFTNPEDYDRWLEAGERLRKRMATEQPVANTSGRLGWAADQNWVIPDDFDRWAEDEILEMFGIKE